MLKPLLLYGWKRNDGKLQFDWDSDTNIQRVQARVQGLLKGCRDVGLMRVGASVEARRAKRAASA